MARIKKIKVFQFAKFQAVLMTLVGVIAGICYSFGGLIYDSLGSFGWITSTSSPGLSYGTVLAFFALIGMPVIFGVSGFILGAVEAVLYNVSVKWFGGMESGLE